MASLPMVRSLVVTICFTSIFGSGTHGGAYIEIQPNKISDIAPEDVNISCRPHNIGEKSQEILLMQISRKGEKPIAAIHQNSKNSHAQKLNSSNPNYEVEGFIDNMTNRSILNVKLLKPTDDWAGTYVCKVYYVAYSGLLEDSTSYGNLTVTKIDSAIIETVIKPLVKKISILEDRTKFLEQETTSKKAKDASNVQKIAILEQKSEDQAKEIRSLVEKEAVVEVQLEQTKRALELQMDGLADKTYLTSLENRVGVLEETTKKEKTNRMTQDTLIKSLKDKETAMEVDLQQINKNIAQGVADRQANKASVTSVTKQINTMEREMGDQSVQLKSLASKNSIIENGLRKSDEKLKQEVANRLNDRASVVSMNKKFDDLNKKNEDQTTYIKSIEGKEAALQLKITSIEKIDAKQSQDIKSMFDRFKGSVSPALDKLKSLQSSNDGLSRRVQGLANRESALETRILNLESKHPKPPKVESCVKTVFGVCVQRG